jgi:hypothetical protein
MEQVITTKRGVYGRVQVTLPMGYKKAMLSWAKQSGMRKADFLRMALVMGYLQLANVGVNDKSDRVDLLAQQPART